MHLQANWIWSDDSAGLGYNQAVEFRRDFALTAPGDARLAITADNFYRVKINGVWLNDGPSRSYPEHHQYDVLEVGHVLRDGVNRIEVLARYFGCGTFHQIPLRAAFLAELRVKQASGGMFTLLTDDSWEARLCPGWVEMTAKVSVQQGPVECIDATRAAEAWHPAVIVAATNDGPWQNLEERDCCLLSRRPFGLARFVGAWRERETREVISWQSRRIYRPGSTSDNNIDSYPTALALEIRTGRAVEISYWTDNLSLFLDGRAVEPKRFEVAAGTHLLLAVGGRYCCHTKDHSLVLERVDGVEFGNPAGSPGEYTLVVAPELVLEAPDIPFMWANEDLHAQQARVETWVEALTANAADAAMLRKNFRSNLWQLTPADMNAPDGYWEALARAPQPLQPGDVENPGALLYDDGTATRVATAPGVAVELLYDFGEQNCGYWEFEVNAAAGTILDFYAVEFITPEGVIQHADGNRNVLRYTCAEGWNRYTSLKRRSGRYLFITVRNAARPAAIQHVGLIESTYPVQRVGVFQCSDSALNRIWEMSERTLKLCMEDTFTDCPLYEQTLWVGDARSEALFAFPVFGAYDLARRCIRIAGRSLEHYPLVGCQVPSAWDCILPAWSFMWGLSVLDYYRETGDAKFIAEVWPMVKQNLAGAKAQIDPATGLFSSTDWNMFDWSPTDSCQKVVTYLTMFLAGAIDAAIELAPVAGDAAAQREYRQWREELALAVRNAWDEERGQWPDYFAEGVPTAEGAVHTAMLAVLFDLTDASNRTVTEGNVLTPRPDLHPVCSPFASLYYYMALEKLGRSTAIVEAILRDYHEMLRLGESTVWETYVSSWSEFPTRSHCHGWSSAPLYFLPRTVLGLRMSVAGAAEFAISPTLVPGMEYASGRIATIRGPVELRWEKRGEELQVHASAPAGVKLVWAPNDSHKGLKVTRNF